MASVGGAAAQGLESGFRMAQDAQMLRNRKEESDREFGLRSAEFQQRTQRQKVLDERADADYTDKVADDVSKNTVGDFAATTAKYGGWDTTPPEIRERLTRQADEAGALAEKARKRRTEAAFGKQVQDLDNIVSNLATGRVQAQDIPPDQLYMAVANTLKRDPTDLMPGPDGAPSPVAKAVGDLTTGMKTGNEGMVLAGANTLFAPELRKGVGSPSPHGGTIVGKEIIKMIPHPDNPGLVSPVVRVYVKGEKPLNGPQPEGTPAGATGHYDAPITENRSTDPNDNVKFIDMKAAMDRVGQMGVLAEMLNHPDIKARMGEGKAAAGKRTQEHLDQYFALGQAAAPKRQETAEVVDLGGKKLRIVKDAQGRELRREELDVTAKPKEFRSGAVQTKLDAIDAGVDAGTFSEDEAVQMKKSLLSGIKPPGSNGAAPRAVEGSRAGGGGGQGASVKITESETKGILKDAANTLASSMGLKLDPNSKRWVTLKGTPATEDQVAQLGNAYEKAATVVRDNAAKGVKTPLTDALNAGKSAVSAVPKTQFEVGKTYKDGQGRMATYQADGTWKVK